MPNVVYCRTNAVVAHGGNRVRLTAGQPWDASDPLVEQYPDMFVGDVLVARSTRDPRGFTELEVEQATRAPGERRGVRRRRDKETTEQQAEVEAEASESAEPTGDSA